MEDKKLGFNQGDVVFYIRDGEIRMNKIIHFTSDGYEMKALFIEGCNQNYHIPLTELYKTKEDVIQVFFYGKREEDNGNKI